MAAHLLIGIDLRGIVYYNDAPVRNALVEAQSAGLHVYVLSTCQKQAHIAGTCLQRDMQVYHTPRSSSNDHTKLAMSSLAA